jgi:hypothetical protein
MWFAFPRDIFKMPQWAFAMLLIVKNWGFVFDFNQRWVRVRVVRVRVRVRI